MQILLFHSALQVLVAVALLLHHHLLLLELVVVVVSLPQRGPSPTLAAHETCYASFLLDPHAFVVISLRMYVHLDLAVAGGQENILLIWMILDVLVDVPPLQMQVSL
jgi:hypothetical protein